MVVKNIVVIDDEVLEKLEEVLEKENSKKPKGETLTIRMLPEELALYQHYVDLTEYKSISDLVTLSPIYLIMIPRFSKYVDANKVNVGSPSPFVYSKISSLKISVRYCLSIVNLLTFFSPIIDSIFTIPFLIKVLFISSVNSKDLSKN